MTYTPPRRSDGTIQTQRVPLPWPKDRPFRILTIDGGGICGILPASVLAELERRYLGGASVARHFDMIAGTSTGGIIALALAHGLTASQIRDIYVERGGNIFPPVSEFGRLYQLIRQGRRTIYDRRQLEQELLKIFGETIFGEARARLCIPAFEGRHGEPWLYKTPHHPDYKQDRFERMVRVGLATAAAPTFFEALPNNGYIMVDGGIWANNPIMNAWSTRLPALTSPAGKSTSSVLVAAKPASRSMTAAQRAACSTGGTSSRPVCAHSRSMPWARPIFW